MLANIIPDISRTRRKSHFQRRAENCPTPTSSGTARNIERELAQLDGLDEPGHTQGLPVYRRPENFVRRLKLALCERTCLKSALAYLDGIGRACWRYSRPGNVDVTFMLKAMQAVDMACHGRAAHPSTHMRYIRLFVRANVLQSIGVRGEYNLAHFVQLNGGPDFWRTRLQAKRSAQRNRDLFDAHKNRAASQGATAKNCINATKQSPNGEEKQAVAPNHLHKSQKPSRVFSKNKENQSAPARGDRLPMQAVAKPTSHADATQCRRPSQPRSSSVVACQQVCVPNQKQPDASATAANPTQVLPAEAAFLARVADMQKRLGAKHVADRQAEADKFVSPGAATSKARAAPAAAPPPVKPAAARARTTTATPAMIREELQLTGLDARVLGELDKQYAFHMLARLRLEAVDWGFIGAYVSGRNKTVGAVRDWRAYLLTCARNHLAAHPSVAA